MPRWSLQKAEHDGEETAGRSECVYCGLKFDLIATLHRHIRQEHRDKK